MLFSNTYYDLIIYTYFLSISIPIWVFVMAGFQIYAGRGNVVKLCNENFWAEFCWTFIPYGLVFMLCYLNMQFLMENEALFNFSSKSHMIKIVGHQWYWSYEDFMCNGGYYDSMITDFVGNVDKPLRIAYGVPCKLAVSSADVIHSFALPDFSLKIDAIPGRVTSQVIMPDRCGVFVGYCSELCGAGHAYMPIVLEVLLLK